MLTVSNYHYIRENFQSDFPSIFGVTPTEFKTQLLLLKNAGQFISADLLADNCSDVLKSPENFLMITFDDGLAEQYDLALPILDSLSIPAIFFANSKNSEAQIVSLVHQIHLLRSIISPADLISKFYNINDCQLSEVDKSNAKNIYRYDDQESACLKFLLNFKLKLSEKEVLINGLFNDYFDAFEVVNTLYMNDNQLKFLAEKGYLGSHTHGHLPIGQFPKAVIEYELKHSKKYFETLTGSPIELVSYPYGTKEAVTDDVVKMAENAGYKIGFTTERGVNCETDLPLELKRFDCNDLIGGKNYKP